MLRLQLPTLRSVRATAIAGALAGLLAAAGALLALADAKSFPPVSDPVVAKECGACHMRFPAGLMPAASWQRIVAGLKDHFGENAEVDAATALHIANYLTTNAYVEPARRGRAAQPAVQPAAADAPLRITELAWFIKEHGPRRIGPEALKRKAARSPGACLACHRDGENGNFDD